MFGSFCIFVIAVVSEMLRHIPLRNFVSGVILDEGSWRLVMPILENITSRLGFPKLPVGSRNSKDLRWPSINCYEQWIRNILIGFFKSHSKRYHSCVPDAMDRWYLFLAIAIEHHEVHLGLQELVGDLELYGKGPADHGGTTVESVGFMAWPDGFW